MYSPFKTYFYICVYILLFSLMKGGNFGTYYNMVEPGGHYAE
jgi:hypothetical protein